MTCRIRWASWGLFAGSLLASAVGCMGTGAGTGGGWPGLSWMRWGRPDPTAVAARDGLAPPSVTHQPDYPKTEQAAIGAPGTPAAAANAATAGNPYTTGQYALGAGENPPGTNAPANPAAAPNNQGFYNTEYNAAGQPAGGQPAGAYAGGAGGYPQGGFGQQPPAQPYPAYDAGGYADNNASPASYQPQADPAAAAYAQANANAAAQYQPQPGYDPSAAANPGAPGGYAAHPSADASAAFAASAGANPPMNPGTMNPGTMNPSPAAESFYGQPAANPQSYAYPQPGPYAANPQAPTSPEGGATGFIEDNSAPANAAQLGYAAQPGAYPAQPSPYAPSPEPATGRAILPNQLPPVNPTAGLTGLPQHRADPRYRPGSARDFFPSGGGDAANTAETNTPGVRPATFYR